MRASESDGLWRGGGLPLSDSPVDDHPSTIRGLKGTPKSTCRRGVGEPPTVSRHPHMPLECSGCRGGRRPWTAFQRTESTQGLRRCRSTARGHGGGLRVSQPRTTKSGRPKQACQTGSDAGLKRFSGWFCSTSRLPNNFLESDATRRPRLR